MANFLFLGVIILGYFFYKFLRRILFVEFHRVCDDTLQNSFSPANVTAAGQGELWENEVTYNRLNNVSNPSTASQKCLEKSKKTGDILEENRISKQNSITNKSFKTSYEIDYDEEEQDLKKKEKMYIAALNRGRPDEHPKILKLPDVGNLPTIFEKMPYPVTAEVLRSLAEDESAGISNMANVPKKEIIHNQSDSKTDEKGPNCVRSAENTLIEEHVRTQLTSNKVARKVIRMQTENKAKKEPVIQLSDNTGKRETDYLQLDNNSGREEATPRIPKKKFRKLRKFFGRFSCIPKVKD